MPRILLSAVTAACLAAGVAQASACFTPEEMRAAQLRQLHVQLQVASLNCRTTDAELPAKYGSYVQRFGGALNANARVLEDHFARSHGKDHRRQMDRYVTQLANEESQRAHVVADYCEDHAPLFDRILALKPAELEGFAVRLIPASGPACGGEKKAQTAKK
ncbi:MAG: heme utilization protein [Actinomycetota bacterium]